MPRVARRLALLLLSSGASPAFAQHLVAYNGEPGSAVLALGYLTMLWVAVVFRLIAFNPNY
jgi:hypothetical protein